MASQNVARWASEWTFAVDNVRGGVGGWGRELSRGAVWTFAIDNVRGHLFDPELVKNWFRSTSKNVQKFANDLFDHLLELRLCVFDVA